MVHDKTGDTVYITVVIGLPSFSSLQVTVKNNPIMLWQASTRSRKFVHLLENGTKTQIVISNYRVIMFHTACLMTFLKTLYVNCFL